MRQLLVRSGSDATQVAIVLAVDNRRVFFDDFESGSSNAWGGKNHP